MTSLDWEEFDGHQVERVDWSAYDLVIGPTCWLMDDAHRQYVDLAIKAARKKRYPAESKGD